MPRTVTYWSAVSLELKGCPAFEVHSLSGREALGELFEYSIVLQSPDSPELSEYVIPTRWNCACPTLIWDVVRRRTPPGPSPLGIHPEEAP